VDVAAGAMADGRPCDGAYYGLHLPAFDPEVSEAVWFRDYAAYCGIATTVRNGGLVAVVAELGSHKAVVQKVIGTWPQANAAHPVCVVSKWQRTPMRATIQATGGEAMTFDVVGLSFACGRWRGDGGLSRGLTIYIGMQFENCKLLRMDDGDEADTKT